MRYLFFWTFLVLLISCKKTEEKPDSIEMQVLEYNTTTPLANVGFRLYTCAHYDFVFGCTRVSSFFSGSTDAQGIYRFTSQQLNKANEGIELTKSQYWKGSGGEGVRYMVPEGWLNVRLIKETAYSDTTLFAYKVVGMGAESNRIFIGRLPNDTTIRMRAFGNQLNTIELYTSADPLLCLYLCFDELQDTMVVQNVPRFQDLSVTRRY